MEQVILNIPSFDQQKLQQAANDAAEKSFLNCITEYYTSYNSPFKLSIREQLSKQEFSYPLELPDILSKINESLSAEIDRIANEAISNTYLPLVTYALCRIEKQIKWSEVLTMIVNDLHPEEEEFEAFSFEYEQNYRFDWVDCTLNTPKSWYKFTLHNVVYKQKEDKKYKLLSFPENNFGSHGKKMTIIKDDVKLEMPFAPNILNDNVMVIFMKLILSGSEIELDCEDFTDEMFPNDDGSR